jgi:hypothetical protein
MMLYAGWGLKSLEKRTPAGTADILMEFSADDDRAGLLGAFEHSTPLLTTS